MNLTFFRCNSHILSRQKVFPGVQNIGIGITFVSSFLLWNKLLISKLKIMELKIVLIGVTIYDAIR